MIRKFATALFLSLSSLASVASAETHPMFQAPLNQVSAVEVISQEIELAIDWNQRAAMIVKLRLGNDLVQNFRFEIPEEKMHWTRGFVSASHHFEVAGKRWYIGEAALWEQGAVLYKEPKVYLPQVRLSEDKTQLEFFLDSEKFTVVTRDLRRTGAFAALHRPHSDTH